MKNRGIFLLLFAALFAGSAFGQQDSLRLKKSEILIFKDSVFIPSNDTVIWIDPSIKFRVKPNPYLKSRDFYKKLENDMDRKRLSRELYQLLVRDTTNNPATTSRAIRSEEYFQDFEDRIIRNISFQSVQMITGSVTDTTRRVETEMVVKINKSHRKTRERILLNNLLFREGDKLDPFLLADSERLLRNYEFINDARIYILPSMESDETVDVIVVTQDRFPWRGTIDFSSFNKYAFSLTQQNLFGTANQITAGFIRNGDESPENGYEFAFESAPISNSFIRAGIYTEKSYRSETYGIIAEKEFVSPVIKYAGILETASIKKEASYVIEDSTYETFFNLNVADVWVARAWRPFRNDRKSVTLGLRNIWTSFADRPVVEADSNNIFHNRSTLLGSVDFSKSNFVKTTNVLSIGITEDLPVGYLIGFTLGANFTEFSNQWYAGIKWQWNQFMKFGYVYFSSEIGGFRNKEGWKEGLWLNSISYLSPLFRSGRKSFRTYARLYANTGLNLSLPVSIRLNNFISGLNGYYTQGNNVYALTIEEVMFTDWYWYGFRFAPFATFDLGYVSENRIQEPYSNVYPALGAGFRITNPGLILSSLSVSMKYFTNPAVDGDAVYLDISISSRLRFKNNIADRPVILPYREFNIFR